MTFCAEAHPFDDATLCRRLDGHSGPHAAAEDDAWDDQGVVAEALAEQRQETR